MLDTEGEISIMMMMKVGGELILLDGVHRIFTKEGWIAMRMFGIVLATIGGLFAIGNFLEPFAVGKVMGPNGQPEGSFFPGIVWSIVCIVGFVLIAKKKARDDEQILSDAKASPSIRNRSTWTCPCGEINVNTTDFCRKCTGQKAAAIVVGESEKEIAE